MNIRWQRGGTKCEARQAGAGGDTCPCYIDSLPPSPAARHSCVAGQDRAGSCPGGWNGNLTTWAGIRLRYLSSFRPRPRSRSRSTRSPPGTARCSCAGSVTPITPGHAGVFQPESPAGEPGSLRCWRGQRALPWTGFAGCRRQGRLVVPHPPGKRDHVPGKIRVRGEESESRSRLMLYVSTASPILDMASFPGRRRVH